MTAPGAAGAVTSAPASAATTAGRRSVVLALLVGAQFIVVLDASIVNVALPSIQRSFAITGSGLQDVVTAYAVAFGAPLILAGRVADLAGRRRMFRAALVGFGATSLLCGFAPSAGFLIGARAVQGLSASFLAPSALALLIGTFDEGPPRMHALSRFGAATVLGSLSGLVVGGVLVTVAGWRSVFFVNGPITALLAVMVGRLLPPDAIRSEVPPAAPGPAPLLARVRVRVAQLDLPGAALATASLADLVLALNVGSTRGWHSAELVVLLGLGAALAVGFVVVELRARSPLLRLGLLRIETVRCGNALIFVFGMLIGAGSLTMGLYLQTVLHYSPLQAGLALVPQGLVGYTVSRFTSRIFTALGLRWALGLSYATVGLAMAALSTVMTVHQRYLVLLPCLVVLGGSQVVSTVGATISSSTGVPSRDLGVVGAIRQTSFQVGLALGVAASASLAATRTQQLVARGVAALPALGSGYRLSIEGLAVVGLTGGLVAVAGLRHQVARPTPTAQPSPPAPPA